MRKLLGLLAVALVSVVAFVLWPRASEPSRITRENYDRIKAGMSLAEVEAILGPPGDYSTGPTKSFMDFRHTIVRVCTFLEISNNDRELTASG